MKKKQIILIIICLFISAITITLTSKNSFLFPFNGWDDFNTFYTLGAGWAQGLIPYKDLFEQKGPVLYLIYMLGYLISPYKFTGIYLLEIISLSLVLIITYKIFNLFINNSKLNYSLLFLYAVLITTSKSFITGGSSEEFNLLFTTIPIYYILKYLKTSKLSAITYKDLFITGLCCGLSLLIKYTTIGLWFIFMAYVCLSLIKQKKYQEALKKGTWFIISMLLPLLIFSIYFYFNNALYDFYNVYFYINIFAYSNKTNLITTIIAAIRSSLIGTIVNEYIYIFFILTILHLIYRGYKKNRPQITKQHITFLTIIVFSFMILYYSQTFRLYAFLAFAWIAIIPLIYLALNFKHFKYIALFSGIIILLLNVDYKYMQTPYEDTVHGQIAKIINQYDNPTIMQYRSIDEGFYTATKTLPTLRFFEKLNLDIPENTTVQDEAIKNKSIDFIILRKFDLDRFKLNQNIPDLENQTYFNDQYKTPYLYTNYELINTISAKNGYYDTCTYYIYQLKKEGNKND